MSPGTLAPRACLNQFSNCRRLLAFCLNHSPPTCRCRSHPPAPQLVEVESRNRWRVHMRVARSVDDILAGRWGSQVEAGGRQCMWERTCCTRMVGMVHREIPSTAEVQRSPARASHPGADSPPRSCAGWSLMAA